MTRRKSPKERERALKGTGSKWRRPDGRYGASIVVPRRDPVTGRITRKRLTTTRKSEEAVDAWLLAKRHEIMQAGGVLEEPEADRKLTLREHLETWLRDSVAPRVAPRTLEKRVWAASNHIAPALGRLPLSEISPQHIQSLYAQLAREGYSLATRREVHVTLRQALGHAVRWGLISRNPASAELVDAPKQTVVRQDEEEIRALSEEQVQRFFEYAESTGSRWRNYYVVAIRTGLRPGEALALRWEDLDLEADPASLRVRRTLDTHGPPRFGPPKTPASRRTLALHFEAREALVAQRAMLASENLPTGPKNLVFPSQSGGPMNAGNLRRRYLQPDLDAAGLPRLTLHELRHTFASIALHDWMLPPKIVQEALGHESLKMTVDLYGHLMPNQQRDAMRRINALYASRRSPGSLSG